jgi:HSP20 family protein
MKEGGVHENYDHGEWLSESAEGELAVDVYQDEHAIYLVAPIAGVRASDVDVSITDEVITIRGERRPPGQPTEDKFFTQECYWGPFSRSYVLPMAVNSEEARATLKDGLLKLEIPKDARIKTRIIKVNGLGK